MNIDIFVEQWMGPESLDYYYIDWVVKEVKRLYGEPRVTVDDYHKKGDLYVTVRFPDGEEYSGLVEKQEGEEE